MSEINNRPKVLENIPNYSELPQKTLGLDLSSSIHDLLIHDISYLGGLLPIEAKYWPPDKEGRILIDNDNPPISVIEEYQRKNIMFQVVNVVINAYSFREIDERLVGKPYSITLVPFSKRGKPAFIDPKYFTKVPINALDREDKMYVGFNPFTNSYGFYGGFETFLLPGPLKIHTDMIGLVYSTYVLATLWNFDEVALPDIVESNDFLRQKYRNVRIRKYFRSFENIKPRKIWGCDSPIELFLLYALDSLGLNPQIQVSIYEDGNIYPSLYHMFSHNKVRDNFREITSADFYFPKERCAVFCDSSSYHRHKCTQEKDARVNSMLEKLGVKTIRVSGKDILSDPYKVAAHISSLLNVLS